MEHGNLSLALFTVLMQSSVGLVIMHLVAKFAGWQTDPVISKGYRVPLLALAAGISGVAVSFSHLGYPLHAVNALNNLGSSWMSLEILLSIVFIVFVSGWFSMQYFGLSKLMVNISVAGAVISGSGLIYAMIRVYTLPAMVYLDVQSVSVSYVSTSLFAGSLLLWLVTDHRERHLLVRIFLLSVIFLSASFLNNLVTITSLPSINRLTLITLTIYLLSLIAAFSIIIINPENKKNWLSVIFIVFALTAELAGRAHLLNYTISGLW
ncbi:MAG: DmsC/YnfH family molybdoenzyme membrane anchor subunit [Bacteroidales bacterium]